MLRFGSLATIVARMTHLGPLATPRRAAPHTTRLAPTLVSLVATCLSTGLADPARADPPRGPEPPRDATPSLVVPPPPRAPGSRAADSKGPVVEQYGEIVIIEGSPELLSDINFGVGIYNEKPSPDAAAITGAFYSRYPDDFDQIIVLTSFTDAATPGALAYELQVKQDVRGLGQRPKYPSELFDLTRSWGSTTGRLAAFVDMKGISDYPRFDGLPIDDPRSLFYPVLGQEFAHRWLAFARYLDAGGSPSERLLGRDGAHWSPTLETGGSLLDGNHWIDRGDGGFDCAGRQVRYSPLDLYLMGLLPASSVPPMFVINRAVTDGGHVIDPATDWFYCEHVRGAREDIGIGQIIAALGPRQPIHQDAPRSFRAAFVLVTRPGQRAAEVVQLAAQAERARKIWERKFQEYTGGTGSVCTQLSVPCGAATARVVGGQIVEAAAGAGANGDGTIEPGEAIEVTFTIENDGPVAAESVVLSVDSGAASFSERTAPAIRIEPGATAAVRLGGSFTRDASACNAPLVVRAEVSTAAGSFKGFASTVAGSRVAWHSRFDDGAARWSVNLEGRDTALANGWAWGRPLGYSLPGLALQPEGGGGGSRGAWFTGLARGHTATGTYTGLTVGDSTLWSPPIDLGSLGLRGGAGRPHVQYSAWFVALDVRNLQQLKIPECLKPRSGPEQCETLLLEGRSAGSGRWVMIDQVTDTDPRWQPRDVELVAAQPGRLGLDLGGPIEFRFRVTNARESDVVEVGVDDFTIVGDAPGCVTGGGSPDASVTPLVQPFASASCATAAGRPDPATALLLPIPIALLLIALRQRTRRAP